jgi:hypothetical protein
MNFEKWYNNIDEPELVEHINRVGIPIFGQGTHANSEQ